MNFIRRASPFSGWGRATATMAASKGIEGPSSKNSEKITAYLLSIISVGTSAYGVFNGAPASLTEPSFQQKAPAEELEKLTNVFDNLKGKRAELRAKLAMERREEEFKMVRREALQELDGLLQDLEGMVAKYPKEVRESTSFDSISLAPDPKWSPEKLRQACEHISSKFKEPIFRSTNSRDEEELLTRTAKFLLLEGDCLEIYGRLGRKATSKYDFTRYEKGLTAFFSTSPGKVFIGVAIGAGLATLGPMAWAAGPAGAWAYISGRGGL